MEKDTLMYWMTLDILSHTNMTVNSARFGSLNELAELFNYKNKGDVVVHVERQLDGTYSFDIDDDNETIASLDYSDEEIIDEDIDDKAIDFVDNLEKFGVFDKLVKMTKCDGRRML